MTTEQIVRVLMAERDKLIAYAWSITGDFTLCEDVVQEVALLAMSRAGEVADEARLKIWLRQSARYKAFEALREKRRTVPLLSEEILDKLECHWEAFDRRSEVAESAMMEFLRECLQKITANQRQLLTLRYSRGLRSREIAEQLGAKIETVYQAIARAHRTLAKCVQDRLAARRRGARDD